MKQRVLLAGFALWLGVVAAGSGLTWLVIQRVGHVVGSQGPVAETPVVGPVRTASPGPSPARPSASGTARPSASPSAATTRPAPRPSPDATTAGPGTSAASPKPPAPRSTRRATPAPTPSSEPRPATVTRTWTGTGGRIGVSCTGSRAALVSASPADGWRVEVEERGPEEVEVRFRSDASEVRVQARCAGAEPRFEVERKSED